MLYYSSFFSACSPHSVTTSLQTNLRLREDLSKKVNELVLARIPEISSYPVSFKDKLYILYKERNVVLWLTTYCRLLYCTLNCKKVHKRTKKDAEKVHARTVQKSTVFTFWKYILLWNMFFKGQLWWSFMKSLTFLANFRKY